MSAERSDLKARLHGVAYGTTFLDVRADILKAIDLIEEAERIIEPFANLGITSGPDEEPCTIPYRITRGSIRKARGFLA